MEHKKHKKKNKACIKTLKGHKRNVISLEFCAKGNLLVSSGFERAIKIWDFTSLDSNLKCVFELEVEDRFTNCLKFNHSNSILATSGSDRSIRLWRVDGVSNKPKCIKTLRGVRNHVQNIIFSIDDRFLISSCNDEILYWDMKTFHCVKSIRHQQFSL